MRAADVADAVIVDLEGATRDAFSRAVATIDAHRLVVRVNPVGTRWHEANLEAVGAAGVRAVLLPKASVRAVADAVRDLRRVGGPPTVIALCETGAGVAAAAKIAASPAARISCGAART